MRLAIRKDMEDFRDARGGLGRGIPQAGKAGGSGKTLRPCRRAKIAFWEEGPIKHASRHARRLGGEIPQGRKDRRAEPIRTVALRAKKGFWRLTRVALP